MHAEILQMIDLFLKDETVEIEVVPAIRKDFYTLYANVEGICRLRIGNLTLSNLKVIVPQGTVVRRTRG